MTPYEPLDPTRLEIRVLSIEPPVDSLGEDAEQSIRSQLRRVDLQDAIQDFSEFRDQTSDPASTERLYYARWRDHLRERTQTSTSAEGTCDEEAAPSRVPQRFRWGDYETLSYSWGPKNLDLRSSSTTSPSKFARPPPRLTGAQEAEAI
jgi:hypothetical protein